MHPSVFFNIDAPVLCLILFAGCILMVIAGKGVRTKFLKKDDQESKGGVNSLLGALFGLWGFVLAFTFGNAATKFENVRSMMVEEASMIRNVLLRSATFPDSLQDPFRKNLRNYLEARIDYYEQAGNAEKFEKSKLDAVSIGKRLWDQTVKASQIPGLGPSANGMMATLTGLFDIGARRDALLSSSIPGPISAMLFFLALVISFVGGFTSPILKPKEWVVIIGFILLACTVIYITIDLSRPMKGLIRPDIGQEKIVQLRRLF
jgi:hypothetical protein